MRVAAAAGLACKPARGARSAEKERAVQASERAWGHTIDIIGQLRRKNDAYACSCAQVDSTFSRETRYCSLREQVLKLLIFVQLFNGQKTGKPPS